MTTKPDQAAVLMAWEKLARAQGAWRLDADPNSQVVDAFIEGAGWARLYLGSQGRALAEAVLKPHEAAKRESAKIFGIPYKQCECELCPPARAYLDRLDGSKKQG